MIVFPVNTALIYGFMNRRWVMFRCVNLPLNPIGRYGIIDGIRYNLIMSFYEKIEITIKQIIHKINL